MISKYTAKEGGPWHIWTSGYVDNYVLKAKLSYAKYNHQRYIILNGCLVHSLKMEDGREWDCVNGWRS